MGVATILITTASLITLIISKQCKQRKKNQSIHLVPYSHIDIFIFITIKPLDTTNGGFLVPWDITKPVSKHLSAIKKIN